MNEEIRQETEEKLNTVLESMSREELAQALRESIQRSEEIESSSKLLVTHLKVLCYKNGGTLSYTREEFDAAAKQDHAFDVGYGADSGKEVCILRLLPREKKADSAAS